MGKIDSISFMFQNILYYICNVQICNLLFCNDPMYTPPLGFVSVVSVIGVLETIRVSFAS